MSELDNIKNSGDLEFQFRIVDEIKKVKEWPRIQQILEDIPGFDTTRKEDVETLIRFIALYEMSISSCEASLKEKDIVIKLYKDSNERLMTLLKAKSAYDSINDMLDNKNL